MVGGGGLVVSPNVAGGIAPLSVGGVDGRLGAGFTEVSVEVDEPVVDEPIVPMEDPVADMSVDEPLIVLLGAVAEVSVDAPVAALVEEPAHQSLVARAFGEAFM